MAVGGDVLNCSVENTKYKHGVNRNARLIVRNISYKATEEALREHFSSYGTIEEVKLLRRPDGKLVGCGFVHFTHMPMANKAIAATNKKPFLGRPVSVAWAVPKATYIEEQSSENIKRKRVDSQPSDASEAPVKKEKDEHNKTKEEKQHIKRKARLIIRNVSFKATEELLKEHFAPYGDILEVTLLKKPDGKLVGCAFVQYKNVPMAKKALLNTNMKPFLGRPISVDWTIAKNEYMQYHINKQLEMQDDVKKEDSDSDDDGPPLNVTNDELKQEVKSESEDESESEGSLKSEEDSSDNADSDASGSDEDDEDDVKKESSDDDDDQSVTSTQPDRQRIKLNDAEDGCTVFIINIPFNIDNDQLKEFAERTGPVKYALICVDKLTEHSKGSGFVKFANKEDADRFMALPPNELKLEGQVLQIKPALKKENLQKGSKKEPKDNRNLYLVKEGVIVAGTKAAVSVSASDMAKRLALERSKTQMLKNLNRFVSRYRLVVSNLPAFYDDAKLRQLCFNAVGRKATITEARVMRDLRAPPGRDGKHPSKGYGFVMFTRHEDALMCLRKLNNNPDVFDKNNRPIVSFSIEDRTALNARKKRLEKSIANNPLAKSEDTNDKSNRKNRKRKLVMPDESYVKKGKFDINNAKFDKNNTNFDKNTMKFDKNNTKFDKNKTNMAGRFVKPIVNDGGEYTGLTAKEGSQHKLRSNQKLRTQADVHRQIVKLEKKKSQRAKRLNMAAKERVKQPKQKINTNRTTKRRRFKRNKSVL